MSEASIELVDGRRAVVRPVGPEDKELLGDAFHRLSEDSRYQRFLTLQTDLSDAQLRYLTEVDHHDHEALIALDPDSGDGVGVARYVRVADRPEAAEAAVVVMDDWQGMRLGTALGRLLADRAREEGIVHFEALLLAGNDRMLGLLESLGPSRIVSHEGGLIEVEIDLPEEGMGEHMRGVLRAAAGGPAELLTPPLGLRQLG
jgi:GNAT superfamily N-acetyltransferase